MGVENRPGSYQHTSGADDRAKLKNAGYGGVRFRDTKGQGKASGKKLNAKMPRGPTWSDAGIPKEITGAPKTTTRPKTTKEVLAYRNKGGIAPTAKNMGSLSVQFRADEATALKAGDLTDRNKRDQNIIDERGGVGGVIGGAPRGNTAMDAFKKKYWAARDVWAEDKNAYSGISRGTSGGSHGNPASGSRQFSAPTPSRAPKTRRAPTGSMLASSKYGLF